MNQYITIADITDSLHLQNKRTIPNPSQSAQKPNPLTSESIKSPSLPLESVNDIHGRHSLSPRVLRVRHRITNHVLQKDLENSASLFVDQATDSLHAASPRQPPNSGLRDALDVVAEHLAMPLRASLSQTLASLSTTRHCSVEIRIGIF